MRLGYILNYIYGSVYPLKMHQPFFSLQKICTDDDWKSRKSRNTNKSLDPNPIAGEKVLSSFGEEWIQKAREVSRRVRRISSFFSYPPDTNESFSGIRVHTCSIHNHFPSTKFHKHFLKPESISFMLQFIEKPL